jgi:hypothetical protein
MMMSTAPAAGAATPAVQVALRIVESQERVVGAAAWKLAKRVRHLNVSRDQRLEISPGADEGEVLDRLVGEFTSITGQLGARMCYMAAADLLRDHPELDVPAFRPFRRGLA